MDRQASKTLIGAFVVGAVILMAAGVMIFGSGKFLKDTSRFTLFFKGSLQGLSVGNAVLFRGVKVGSVKSITIEADSKDLSVSIPVIIEIDPALVKMVHEKRRLDIRISLPQLIDRGFRAQLTMGSLVTGQLMVGLGFYPDTPVRTSGIETEYPEIPTIPSPIERITDVMQRLPVEDIINKLLSAFEAVEALVESPDIPNALHALRQTVEDAGKLINNLDSRIEPLSVSVDQTVAAYKKLAQDVDAHVEPLASRMDTTLEDARKLVQNVDGRSGDLARSMETTLEKAREALEHGRKTLDAAKETISKDSPLMYELDQTIREISTMARSIRSLADYLERHPDALLYGKGAPKRR
ncbi:MAG: MlaD family protein [Deltaproteobacteria bacterium]|nr:MlaD family protein [Deltaproteobacteria bacterium]